MSHHSSYHVGSCTTARTASHGVSVTHRPSTHLSWHHTQAKARRSESEKHFALTGLSGRGASFTGLPAPALTGRPFLAWSAVRAKPRRLLVRDILQEPTHSPLATAVCRGSCKSECADGGRAGVLHAAAQFTGGATRWCRRSALERATRHGQLIKLHGTWLTLCI